jgi:hypothetical protein
MMPEDYQQYVRQISNFLADQEKIKEQYNLKGLQTHNESIDFFGNDIIYPLTLCDSTILFLIFSVAEKHFAKDKKQLQKMQLVTAYLQGIDISTNLILEGNYIKASATLKQDFETIVRLNEVHTNRAKKGKTPNAQNGPPTYKEMYGYLNDIAHIAKDGILNFVLKHESENSKGVSPVKKFNKIIAHRLMTYNAAVKVEMFRQCLNLYFELAGEDKVREQAMVYYNVVKDIYSKIGMLH